MALQLLKVYEQQGVDQVAVGMRVFGGEKEGVGEGGYLSKIYAESVSGG